MKSISQSPTDPDFVQDPYPFYARARSIDDILWWEEYGMPVAFSRRAVDEILKHRGLGRGAAGGERAPAPDHLRDFEAVEAHSLLELDGQRHARLRRLVVGALTGARISAMSLVISNLTDDLIGGFPAGPLDFIDRFAERLPVTVISRLLGVPDEMAPHLRSWSQDMVAMYQARRDRTVEEAANTAAKEFRAYLQRHVAQRRKTPGDDLLSELIAASERGDVLDCDELVATTVLLLNAGHEATVHTLGNGLYTLLRLEQPYEALMPQGVTATVEEILRFDPPLHLFTREAHDDVTIAGVSLRKGARVGACLAAANRDPEVWAAPDTFDPTRPTQRQLAFGAGPHFCIGAPLARLELQIALPALYSPQLALRLVEAPRYADLYHFHGLERLMVERTAF